MGIYLAIRVYGSLKRVCDPVQRDEFHDSLVRGSDVAPFVKFLSDPGPSARTRVRHGQKLKIVSLTMP